MDTMQKERRAIILILYFNYHYRPADIARYFKLSRERISQIISKDIRFEEERIARKTKKIIPRKAFDIKESVKKIKETENLNTVFKYRQKKQEKVNFSVRMPLELFQELLKISNKSYETKSEIMTKSFIKYKEDYYKRKEEYSTENLEYQSKNEEKIDVI